MLSSRKSASRPLTIAIALVAMLVMLVPAAIAAPEWVHGVTIDDVDPMYIEAPDSVAIDYTLAIVGTQVDSVWVWFGLLDQMGNLVDWEGDVLLPAQIVAPYEFSHNFGVGPVDDGWYDVEVCVMDGDWNRPLFCDTMENAVLVDYNDPLVDLVKPAFNAWVTGTDYLMVGEAVDDWALDPDSVVFEYCAITNWTGMFCGVDNDLWVKIADGEPTPGVPDQYQALWDTSQVPDDLGVVRFCAADMVGHDSCDWAPVYVNNRYTINLQPGWNLISSPLLPYNTDINDVLFHLVDHGTVKQVVAMDRAGAGYDWMTWNADPAVPSDLATFEDGKGYWVEMLAADSLTIVGTWSTTGAAAPPEYPVYDGWNLIGYTQWGVPTWAWPKSAGSYLSAVQVQQLYRYNAVAGIYVSVPNPAPMTLGAGYWLATSADGRINP